MTDFKDDIIVALLDCGYADIYVFDQCQYEMSQMCEECKDDYGEVNINNLARTMFNFGLRDIANKVDERIKELQETENPSEAEKTELEAIKELSPFDDFGSYHNCLDTSIWLERHDLADTYKTYMQEALDDFEEMTGYAISVW